MKDRTIDNPYIGTVSCAGLKEAYIHCVKMRIDINRQGSCSDLREAATVCFTRSDEYFNDFVREKYAERIALNEFMKKNGSVLYDMRKAANCLTPFEIPKRKPKQSGITEQSVYELMRDVLDDND